MAKGRGERKEDEQPAKPPEVRFTPLDEARWEDSGYLPSEDDQSWREMEALRIAAFDRIGHLPPQGDQSWREREAMRIAAPEGSEAEETPDLMPDEVPDPVLDQMPDQAPDPVPYQIPEPKVPLPELQPARHGSGGVMFLLGGFVGLVVLAFAAPDLLSPDFWRAQWAGSPANPVAAPQRMANVPPAPPAAVRPPPTQSLPAPDNGRALNAEPPADSQPPANVEPPATAEPHADAAPDVAPRPRPDMRASTDPDTGKPKTMLIRPDGTVKYENGLAASKPASRDTGGVYAMAPGLDGKLRYQYFPSTPKTGARAADDDAARDTREPGGVYAMAPGPDGILRYQYFPAKPPR